MSVTTSRQTKRAGAAPAFPLGGSTMSYTDRFLNWVRERFWAKVDGRGPDDCWEWQGATAEGYGLFIVWGHPTRAHRVAWEFTHGPIPAGLLVLHSCDNPPCVNPAHLRIGTDADNTADMHARGRAAPKDGEHNGHAKLTAAQVAEIRAQYAAGEKSTIALGREFGVSPSAIGLMLKGATWAAVGEPIPRRSGNAHITLDDARAIRGLWESGELTQAELAERFGLCRTAIRNVLAHRTWKEPDASAAA